MADVNEDNNNMIVVCVSVCTRLSSCVIPSFVVFVSQYSPCVFFPPQFLGVFVQDLGVFKYTFEYCRREIQGHTQNH